MRVKFSGRMVRRGRPLDFLLVRVLKYESHYIDLSEIIGAFGDCSLVVGYMTLQTLFITAISVK